MVCLFIYGFQVFTQQINSYSRTFQTSPFTMNIAFYLAHPSQYYVFREIMKSLKNNGHQLSVFIKTKDILEELLIRDHVAFVNVFSSEKKSGLSGLISSVFQKNKELFLQLKKQKVDLLVTAASDSSQASFLRGIPSVVLNDDDSHIIKKSVLFGWPFTSAVLAPRSCHMGYWSRKTIAYKGYQKLAYLHPRYYQPDDNVLKSYGLFDKRYFLIRSVSLTAHHDKNIRGLGNDMVEKLIEVLSPYGRVLISSERQLPDSLQNYQLKINPLDIHHVLHYAGMLIGDSQSMAHEAALLGTPSIRFNDFVGRIGVLEELEHTWQLTYGISPDNPAQLLQKAEEIAGQADTALFRNRAKEMMSQMIDLPAFVVWFIENYPQSHKTLKQNPDYQNNFIR